LKLKDVKAKLMGKKKTQTKRKLLSSGSTLLNLACTNRVDGAFDAGKYYFFVGDSQSGKTFLCLGIFAEAANDSRWDDYRLIYDNVEDGALMDLRKFFGGKTAERLEAPMEDDEGNQAPSFTIEEFYYNVDDAFSNGPCIYILDSMDALTSNQEQDKFKETKKAHRAGKDTTGSFGDGKAKKNAANLRRLFKDMNKHGSILIIISQTRDNLKAMNPFDTKTRSGGRALKFYATLEMWTARKGKIKKTVKGKERVVGIQSKVQVKKNRETGNETAITVPILRSYGIDDISSCIDFLVSEKHWKKKGQTIDADELDFNGTKEKLIRYIEEEELVTDLRETVGYVWDEIEKASMADRKPKYD